MIKDDLDTILAAIWQSWARGKRDRHSPLHTPVVGTADGNMRVMVLRQADAMTSSLRFHTDVRTSKVTEIGGSGPVSVLGYDPAEKVQIRGWGRGRIEAVGEIADAAWAASAPSSRRCYLAEAAPGCESALPTSGLPAHVENRVPEIAETEPGRANFAVLIVTLERLEWLHLAHDGHRRARFVREDGQWQGCWLVP